MQRGVVGRIISRTAAQPRSVRLTAGVAQPMARGMPKVSAHTSLAVVTTRARASAGIVEPASMRSMRHSLATAEPFHCSPRLRLALGRYSGSWVP
jgi:hypothetical protein